MVQSALLHESFDFRESLVPVEVGVIHQEVARPSPAEHVQEGKIMWIGPHGGGHGGSREAYGRPFSRARAAPVQALQRLQHAGQRGEQKNQQRQRDGEMTNAEVQPIQHARGHEDHQRDPQRAPVQFHAAGDGGYFSCGTASQEEGNRHREKEQKKKRQRRLQDTQHRKIKPDAMGIRVAQNVGWSAPGA